MKNSTKVYIRPEWTCGKFNRIKEVAIMYNLIEGISYFFEDASAIIIGEILSVKRNSKINFQEVCKFLSIDKLTINSFIEDLKAIGLIIEKIPSEKEIKDYRIKIGKDNLTNRQTKNVQLNQESNNAERLYSKALGENTISSVMFELTYNCNEMCLHCFNPGATRNNKEKSGRSERSEILLDDYKRIIDELDDYGIFKITLTGGEPFLKKDIWEILRYINKKNIAFDIFTNGQHLINRVEEIASYYPRLIGLSLYSGIAKDHDKITRVKGSHEKTVSVIRQLSTLGISMNLKCVVMQPNIKSYYTIKNIAKVYSAEVQFDINVTDSVEGDKCATENLRLNEEMMEVILHDPEISNQLSYVDVTSGKKRRVLGDKICGAGIETFSISPEGNVQPCVAFPFSFGNIKNTSLRNILDNSTDIDWWKKQRPDDLLECYKHDYCSYCRVCPGNNFVENGNPLIPSDNNCSIAKMKCNLARKMKDGFNPLKNKSLEERLDEIELISTKLSRINSFNFRKTGTSINGQKSTHKYS